MADSKDLLAGLPFPIGLNVIRAMSRYDRSEFAADIAIGNVPYLMAPSDDRPYTRLTTQFQRDRVDQAASAGEQSLSNWWIRNQTSWHKGAGITYYDAVDDDLYRFADSNNVDVWTQGQMSLLSATDRLFTTASVTAAAVSDAGVWFMSSGKIYTYTASTNTVAEVSGWTSLSLTATAICSDGSTLFVGCSAGIYKIVSAGTVTKIYSNPTGGWSVSGIAYVKDRLIVCASVTTDPNPMQVFELGANPASPPVTVSVSTDSRYQTTNPAVFVGIAEISGAILVAIKTGSRSKVLSFYIDTSAGGAAAMLDPISVAELPTGEVINAMGSYLNSYVVLATNRGVRVGTETSNGLGFTYGPLSIKDDVAALTFDGEYVYAARSAVKDATKGLWRIHLGTKNGDQYAYASDLSTSSSGVQCVCPISTTGRLFIGAADGGWVQSATQKAASGYLTSGRIRFGTAERKQPVSVASIARQNYGTIEVTVTDLEGTVASFARVGDGTLVNAPLSADMRPSAEAEITVELTRGASNDPGPIFDEWQLRALPAPQRSRTITIPLLCFEEERDQNGQIRVSNPWDRVQAMEYLEQTGGSCLYQNFATGEERVVVIRAVQFEQFGPPSTVNGFGGILTIQLQTVDTEVF